jgi:tetratricopeptide (TPR) repeat protein
MILWNWRGAEDSLEIGLHRNPNNTAALGTKAHLSLILGDVDAARDALEKAERIDPESPDVWTQRAMFEHRTGRTEEGIRWLMRVAEARPEDPSSAIRIVGCYLHLGKLENAKQWIGKIEDHPAMADGRFRLVVDTFAGVVAAREGRDADVEHALATIRGATSSARRHANAAFVLVAAGREDEAFDELDEALAIHDPWLTELPAEPLMICVRSRPRFQQMLGVMGLGSGVSATR